MIASTRIQYNALRRVNKQTSNRRLTCFKIQASSVSPEGNPSPKTSLADVIKRKQREIQAQFAELGEEAVEERLQSIQEVPPTNPHRLTLMISERTITGRTALLVEACRDGDAINSSEALAEHAAELVKYGADAIVVRTDIEDTPTGMSDLFAVVNRVQVPVLMKDWIIHPLQIVEARTAGASGCIGISASVMNKAAPVLSSFSAAIGLDSPVEVVNTAEREAMEKYGIPFWGFNLTVGLSIGFGSDIAASLVQDLPFGVTTVVGVSTLAAVQKARLAGADALMVKKELVGEYKGKEGQLMQLLIQLTDGDD